MIPAVRLLTIFILTLTVLATVSMAAAQGQWTRYGSTPILTTPAWAPYGVIRPRVVYDGKIFRMWFSGLNAEGVTGIGYASSKDGMSWVENPQPVLTAGTDWEGNYISIGSVVWTGSEFMMWYRGVGGRQGAAQANGAVGLATSPDGVTWKKYFANPVMITTTVDSSFLSAPYVIQVGSGFKMWYTCSSPGSSYVICSATSPDGINWTKQSAPVLEAASSSSWEGGGLFSPSVIYDGTTYGMWFSASNSANNATQIGYATSNDGVTWTAGVNPILSPGSSNAWDGGAVENQCVIQVNSGFLLYYDGAGTSQTSLNYIGLAQSPTGFMLAGTG